MVGGGGGGKKSVLWSPACNARPRPSHGSAAPSSQSRYSWPICVSAERSYSMGGSVRLSVCHDFE